MAITVFHAIRGLPPARIHVFGVGLAPPRCTRGRRRRRIVTHRQGTRPLWMFDEAAHGGRNLVGRHGAQSHVGPPSVIGLSVEFMTYASMLLLVIPGTVGPRVPALCDDPPPNPSADSPRARATRGRTRSGRRPPASRDLSLGLRARPGRRGDPPGTGRGGRCGGHRLQGTASIAYQSPGVRNSAMARSPSMIVRPSSSGTS